MSGGINAWEGLTAEGAPESGMVYFPDSARPEELIAVAWKLEEGSRKFYSAIPSLISDSETIRLFADLEKAEEHHKASLAHLYKELFPAGDGDSIESVLSSDSADDIMEGGINVADAVKWAEGKQSRELLEFSISAEANAYDLYIKLERKLEDSRSRKIFAHLSGEEKHHLERMAALLEKKI